MVGLISYPSIDSSLIAVAEARFDQQILVLLRPYIIACSHSVAYSTTSRTLGPSFEADFGSSDCVDAAT